MRLVFLQLVQGISFTDLLVSDGSCKIWSIFSKRELMSMEIQGPQLQEMKWDYTGSLLCTGTKNREFQIWDPRTVSVVTNWVVCFDCTLHCRAMQVLVVVT